MEKGVKEMLELISGMKEVALIAKQVQKSESSGMQKVLEAVAALAAKQAVLVAAVEGVADVPGEAKDLTLDEAMQVVSALVEAAKEVKAA